MPHPAPDDALNADAFEPLIEAFAPFEPHPHIAVAVSGGGDSMALCLLAAAWARRVGGRVTALTIDHGLRSASATEASQVGQWLGEYDIPHVTLRWEGSKPRRGLQEAARRARYGLLEAWCRDAGVLHLLLGHTRDDQAETVLMRAAQATGSEGLAGMSAVVERQYVRILRPFLGLSREHLRGVLARGGLSWIEDPSNDDTAFSRVRARRAITAEPGLCDHLNTVASKAGRARLVMEAAVAAAGASCVQVHPAGFAWLNLHSFRALPDHLALALLARLMASVGGQESLPKRQSIARVQTVVAGDPDWRGMTLSGCHLMRAKGDRALVCRERRNLPQPTLIFPEMALVWDNRFAISVADGSLRHRSMRLAPLGAVGWAEIKVLQPTLANFSLPATVRIGLPALWDEGGVLEVPHMAYRRAGCEAVIQSIRFQPIVSLSALGHWVAPGAESTI